MIFTLTLFLVMEYFYQWRSAVIEFDISGLTGSGGVTQDNFQSAHLDGLQIVATGGDFDMRVDLHDLNDYAENGVIDGNDLYSYNPNWYIRLFSSALRIKI